MENQFKNNQNFTQLIKSKQDLIKKRTSSKVIDSNQFKFLYSLLTTYLRESAFNEFKLIVIHEDELFHLSQFININMLKSVLDSDSSVFSPCICLNRDLKIIDNIKDLKLLSCKSTEMRSLCIEVSREKYVIFQLQPEYINYYVDGDELGDGVFCTMSDFQSYQKRRPISEINELFDEYRTHLKDRDVYSKFFISKSHLISLHKDLNSSVSITEFTNNNKHILQNKPEDRFREDLRGFLSSKLKAIFLTKEHILQNFKRLDIFLSDEEGNGLYLIEVKWVGDSIHSEGKRIGTTYNMDNIVPDAVLQTVGYLKQLHLESKNIKLGYLVVFDARFADLEDTDINISTIQIPDCDKMHLSKFRKVRNFRVKNVHPN